MATLQALATYQESLCGIAVESTYNWYWLVVGLMDAGYRLHLVNTSAVQQYAGIVKKPFNGKKKGKVLLPA